jgi:hypothetical protein
MQLGGRIELSSQPLKNGILMGFDGILMEFDWILMEFDWI